MSWKLPKAKPAKTKEHPPMPEVPEGETDETGQYVWVKWRWCWCWYPKPGDKIAEAKVVAK